MISLNDQEIEIVILALSKILDTDPQARVDEYKKLLHRLKDEDHPHYVHTIDSPHELDEF